MTDILYTPLKNSDSEDFFTLAGDERVAATMRFDCPKNKEESDEVLKYYLSEENLSFAIRSESHGQMWGVFAFKGSENKDTASLSLMLLPSMWGQGLGTRIIEDMADLAKKEKLYKALEGNILEGNTASRKMAERNGFKEYKRNRYPGMKEDLITYRLEIL